MKVAIACFPVYGGSGVVASELGLALAHRGHDVHFVSYDKPFRIKAGEEHVTFHAVEVLHYPLFRYPPYALSLAAKLIELSRDLSLDVIHAHYAVPHAAAAIMARDAIAAEGGRAPAVVTTLHGTDTTLVGSHPSFKSVTRYAIESSDGVTAVSAFLASVTRETFDLSRDVRVIPNFVDSDRFAPRNDPDARRQFAPDGEVLLVHVSNFREVKRACDCVDVLAKVNSERPARLLLIGDGPDAGACCERARELGVRDRVAMAGMRDDLEAILPFADVFLLPSEYESFGLAALEAMSCGVPVVASDVGGLPELVDRGYTGYLLPVGDRAAFARAVLAVVSDPGGHAAMRAAARRTAVERFATPSAMRFYEECYADAITVRRGYEPLALSDGRYASEDGGIFRTGHGV